MGICLGAPDNNINFQLQQARALQTKEKHLLLLGTGSSGKSTLFKQLGQNNSLKKQNRKYIQGERFVTQDYVHALQAIRTNCVQAIITLLKKSEQLYLRGHKHCHVNFEDTKIASSVMELYKWWMSVGQVVFNAHSERNVPVENTVVIGRGDTFNGGDGGFPKPMPQKMEKNSSQVMLVLPSSQDDHYNDYYDNNNNNSNNKQKTHIANENKSQHHANQISIIYPMSTNANSYDWDTIERMGKIIKRLWDLQGVRNTFNERNSFSFPDNMDFYLNKVEDIMKFAYVCTEEDCLK
ncbi:guanine nucleotide binding protein (G protein), alpha inhibiting activity polypeptide a, partial [Reticulomyxa filosa]